MPWQNCQISLVSLLLLAVVLISDRRYEAVATTWYLILAGNYRQIAWGPASHCRYILILTGQRVPTITTLPVGCSFWTRFLISVLNICLVSAEMEQIRVGQDNVDVTNLSRAADFLQLLHVSSGKRNICYNSCGQERLPTWRENTSPRPRCPRPRGLPGGWRGCWGSWWWWQCTPPPQSRHPDTLCHDPDQHHPMMNLCQTGTPQKARKDSSCKIRKLTLKIFPSLACFVLFHKEILNQTRQFLPTRSH